MSDLHLATAAPSLVKLADRTYEVGPLKMKSLGVVQAWIEAQPCPDRVAELKALKDDLEPSYYQAALTTAFVESQQGRDLIMGGGYDLIGRSDAGRRTFFAAILREHQPGLTDEEVNAAYDDCTPVSLAKLFALAVGAPEPTQGADPKDAVPANGVPATV